MDRTSRPGRELRRDYDRNPVVHSYSYFVVGQCTLPMYPNSTPWRCTRRERGVTCKHCIRNRRKCRAEERKKT